MSNSKTSIKPSLQDFTLVKTYVEKATKDNNLDKGSLGFYFFALNLVLNLQDDEIDNSITDTAYLEATGKSKGHDRGIDAIFIDESDTIPHVHLFNFKYTEKFNKVSSHFPSSEIDKIVGFLNSLLSQDDDLEKTINGVLANKVKEIWSLFSSHNPKFTVHICSNLYNSFEKLEQERFERDINRFSSFNVKYHSMHTLVSTITKGDKQQVNARIRAIDKNLFEKSDGDIRALIVNIETRDLLRIVLDDTDIRNDVDIEDYGTITEKKILEDAFEDNVRVYLKQRSKINRNIRETALSDESQRFFYFNNGITITCSSFNYPASRRSPIIELENIQIVNGSQTIHALHDAFCQDISKFEDMDILCRIYETRNEKLSTDIAEYTNSQNPVKSRDIRSNDFIQKKLESELIIKGFFYERKKNQHFEQAKRLRIDAEKVGQALMAFYNNLPAEAKNKKRLIFSEKYDSIFTDELTADKVLLSLKIWEHIEERKITRRKEILQDKSSFEERSYILHASYYILYTISKLCESYKIDISLDNQDEIINLYDKAIELIETSINKEINRLDGFKDSYSHRVFFTTNRPKSFLEELCRQVS